MQTLARLGGIAVIPILQMGNGTTEILKTKICFGHVYSVAIFLHHPWFLSPPSYSYSAPIAPLHWLLLPHPSIPSLYPPPKLSLYLFLFALPSCVLLCSQYSKLFSFPFLCSSLFCLSKQLFSWKRTCIQSGQCIQAMSWSTMLKADRMWVRSLLIMCKSSTLG